MVEVELLRFLYPASDAAKKVRDIWGGDTRHFSAPSGR